MSQYLQYLPAIFQDDAFLGQFLLAIERMLTGLHETQQPEGLEQVADRIDTWFDPHRAPPEFLPWLAGWVAASLRDDWSEEKRRRFIRKAPSMYRWRGTRKGLQDALNFFLDVDPHGTDITTVVITEDETVPHFFEVVITVGRVDTRLIHRADLLGRTVIDQEKPAHTAYRLRIKHPSMVLTDRPPTPLIVGKNTIL